MEDDLENLVDVTSELKESVDELKESVDEIKDKINEINNEFQFGKICDIDNMLSQINDTLSDIGTKIKDKDSFSSFLLRASILALLVGWSVSVFLKL